MQNHKTTYIFMNQLVTIDISKRYFCKNFYENFCTSKNIAIFAMCL